jgi:hypothetical protein
LPDGANARRTANQTKENIMLYTIAMVLIILWLLGLVSGYALGGFIHILLVIAIVVILLRLISGQKPV